MTDMAVLQQLLTVIRGQDHRGPLQLSRLIERRENPTQEVIHLAHRRGIKGPHHRLVLGDKRILLPRHHELLPDRFADAPAPPRHRSPKLPVALVRPIRQVYELIVVPEKKGAVGASANPRRVCGRRSSSGLLG